MTNNKPTDERLSLIIAETLGVTAARGEHASVEVNAALFVSVLTELQECRKAALEMRALITSEICDFFAGLEQPGEPKGVQAMQSELLLRNAAALAGCLVAPKFTEEF